VIVSAVNPCLGCPGPSGEALGALAELYVPPAEWLFSENELGPFSVDAIRTVVENYSTGGSPGSPRYAQPNNIVDPREVTLFFMSRRYNGQGIPGALAGLLAPDDIEKLQQIAADRAERQERFEDLSKSDQARRAAAAAHFWSHSR
jgi:hypothetical protein